MWRKGDFIRFRGRSRADRQLLIEAMLWLGVARSAILTVPFRWAARLLALSPGGGDTVTDQRCRELAQRVGWAVSAASSRSPWKSTCLTQALAGAGMLRRRQIPATLTMGVAKSTNGWRNIEAHAWLSCDGIILTGADGRDKYTIIGNFSLSVKKTPYSAAVREPFLPQDPALVKPDNANHRAPA